MKNNYNQQPTSRYGTHGDGGYGYDGHDNKHNNTDNNNCVDLISRICIVGQVIIEIMLLILYLVHPEILKY